MPILSREHQPAFLQPQPASQSLAPPPPPPPRSTAALVILNGSTVLLLTPAPEQECQAARGWWSEDSWQKDSFNISVALARNELEMPVLQWLELDGSVLGEIA